MAYTCALYDVLQKQFDQYIVSCYIGIPNPDLIYGKDNLPCAFNYFVFYVCSNLYYFTLQQYERRTIFCCLLRILEYNFCKEGEFTQRLCSIE